MIISLNLGTETHSELLPPRGFQEVPFVIPNLSVLKDCLCFCHDFKQTHFVIWQMKEFRVEESWTQFLKISYHNLQIDNNFNYLNFYVSTICPSEKNDTLLLKTSCESSAILYNWRDKSVKRIKKSWIMLKAWFRIVESKFILQWFICLNLSFVRINNTCMLYNMPCDQSLI